MGREEALTEIVALQNRIASGRAETLADAAVLLRRLAVDADTEGPSLRGLLASVLAVVEREVDAESTPAAETAAYPTASPDQDRRARRRDGDPHQGLVSDSLSGSSDPFPARRQDCRAPALIFGAACLRRTLFSATSNTARQTRRSIESATVTHAVNLK